VTCFYAVAWDWRDGGFDLRVFADDGFEWFGDTPVDAATPAGVPAAGSARLARAGWRVVGEWVAAWGAWVVEVELVRR